MQQALVKIRGPQFAFFKCFVFEVASFRPAGSGVLQRFDDTFASHRAVRLTVMMQPLFDVLQREFGGVFAAPILLRGSNGPGSFEAGDVVTTVAPVAGNGPPADIIPLHPIPLVIADKFLFAD